MTMEHIARSFSVSLSITHPDMDPTEISKAIELTPKRTTRAGAPRTTSRGDSLTGTYEFSSWVHSFHVQGASELGVVIQDLARRLQRHEPFFRRIVEGGGSVELFCCVRAAGNWDEILSHSLMGQLSALHIDLRLDVYPKVEKEG